jgi:protein-tyrosine kinase
MSLVQDMLRKVQDQSAARTTAGSAQSSPALAAAPLAPPRRHSGEPESTSGPLVEIDQNSLRAAGLLPPHRQERELAEQFRQIKRPLIAAATGRGATRLAAGHLIMLASAMSGEGKTFTALNLAISMACEKDIRVLLVDADVAKPHISRLLGLGSAPGLLDALRDSTLDIESLIRPTNIPGLSVLPAGQPGEHTTELLASERMLEIAHRIAERDPHRIALFDSPPLLQATESQALAQALGQVVLVVRAGETPQQAVLDAVERLGEGKRVAVVLNQSITRARERYPFYGQSATQENQAMR